MAMGSDSADASHNAAAAGRVTENAWRGLGRIMGG
ncbi:MAG: hypothetical protein JWL81_2356 [Verrucomicrobiales bacterium]|nr:hypothetical protein [Verrucomicrobiales bacterium]